MAKDSNLLDLQKGPGISVTLHILTDTFWFLSPIEDFNGQSVGRITVLKHKVLQL